MKYETPNMEVMELIGKDVFMTSSPDGNIGSVPSGGGGDFQPGEEGEQDGF